MNPQKIGKFIAEQRKIKKITQAELAEKLGVTDKSVGNWENGRNLPDSTLFKPLCDELGITVTDLINGEKVDKEQYQEKLEENMINTIDYANKRISKMKNKIGIILFVLGIIISIISLAGFSSISIFNGIFSMLGIIISVMGICELTRNLNCIKRLMIIVLFLIIYFCVLFTIDSLGIIDLDFSFYI